MPNHVTNRLVITGPIEDVAELKKLMIKDVMTEKPSWWNTDKEFIPVPETRFDFNQIIPQPKILDYIRTMEDRGPNNRVMIYDHIDPSKGDKGREATEAEQLEIDTAMAYVEPDSLSAFFLKKFPDTMPPWYDWRVNNWGTKWNGYDYRQVTDRARLEFTMDTAWDAPTPIFNALAQKFPNVGFDIAWYDEGGMHAGQGSLGHCATTGSSEDFYTEPTDAIFELVYGEPPLDNHQELRDYFANYGNENHLRIAHNFTCEDVGAAMNKQGEYSIHAEMLSTDDPYLDDDEILAIRQVADKIRAKVGIS